MVQKKIRMLAQMEEESAEVQEDVVEIDDDLVGEEEEEDEGLVESDEEVVETIEEEDDEAVEDEVEEQREEEGNTGDVEPLEMDEDSNANLDVTAQVEEVQLEHEVAEELIESETFVAGGPSQSTSVTASPHAPSLRPPPREDRLPSFGRNTLAYEDGGDDGIVPSTPVLLRPRANDGFAEAVSSPQVNTRFVFAAVPDLSVPSGSAALSHLESQSMEDTRMDLSQLEESAGRGAQESSFAEAAPNSLSGMMEAVPATAEVAPIEEQGDFEGGPDLEGDADAEFDLLGEEDPESREADQQAGATPVVAAATPTLSVSVPSTPASSAPVPSATTLSTHSTPASTPSAPVLAASAAAAAPTAIATTVSPASPHTSTPAPSTSTGEQPAAERSQVQEAPLSFADVAGPSSSAPQSVRLSLR